MGAAQSQREDPPKVVLVPPMFERDIRGRSRFAKSSYDTLFGKPALHRLFHDYVTEDCFLLKLKLRPTVTVSPQVLLHSSILLPLHTSSSPVQQVSAPAASLTCRIEPVTANPSWVAIKVAPAGTQLRACCFDPRSGLSVFATLQPLAAWHGGVRFASQSLGAGINGSGSGLTGDWRLQHAWLVARHVSSNITAGVQYAPKDGADVNFQESWCISYSPAASALARGSFTAAVEVVQRNCLRLSFLHHFVAVRQVRNPLEDANVVGIQGYVDLGLEIESDLVTPNGPPRMRLGAAWQANKNVLVKASLGTQRAAVSAAFKVWSEPSWTLAATCAYDFVHGRPRLGLQAGVENYGNIRYERSSEQLMTRTGRALVQRHVAYPIELANREGKGLLVPRNALDPAVLGQVEQPSAALL